MGHSLAIGAGPQDRRHQHMTTAGAAAATLAVIVGSAVLAHADIGGRNLTPPEDPRVALTELGRRALDELPLAYQAGDAVVVPAATDPSISWTDVVTADRIEGTALPLGVRGLVDYGHVSSLADAPAWTGELTEDDRVLADAGPLWFACTRRPGEEGPGEERPGEEGCTASLLMYHDLRYYFFEPRLGSARFLGEGAPMEVLSFESIAGTELQHLLVGGLDGTETERVRLTTTDGSRVSAWTSTDSAVAGETMWWAAVPQPVESVTAYDADGDVVAWVVLAQ